MENEKKILGLTIGELREVLEYQPSLGTLIWKKSTSQRRAAGDNALMVIDKLGYFVISMNYERILAHRLIYSLMTGEYLDCRLRFKDGNSQNVKWENIEKVPYVIDMKVDYTNREEILAYQKKYRTQKPEINKNSMLLKNYGISLDKYNEMLLSQKGCCAICDKPEIATLSGKIKSLSVDHDHKDGSTRELLCQKCNLALGAVNDSDDLLTKMISYLKKHRDAQKNSNIIPLIRSK